MNGGHDVGSMHGFGPIDPEQDEPTFHSEWERRAFALTLAMGSLGYWNLDQSRFAREQMPPGEYLTTSYYEHWLYGLEVLMREHDLLSEQDIAARMQALAAQPVSDEDDERQRVAESFPGPASDRVLRRDAVATTLGRGGSARMDVDAAARFAVGDRVQTIDEHPAGHTRLPRYARRKIGSIAIDQGGFIFPDSHADGEKRAERLYTVRFDAKELWGTRHAYAGDDVHIDLFDSYLSPSA